MKIADGRVCMLMQSGFIWGGKRGTGLYVDCRPDHIVIIPERIYFYEAGKPITRPHNVGRSGEVVWNIDAGDKAQALSGNPGMPYRWTPEYGARLGVLRRDDPYGTVRWFEIEPCFVYHALNAHEEQDGRRLVLHAEHPAAEGRE